MMVNTLPAVPHSLPSPVPSPCVSLCKMNRNSGLCEGCLRTLDEIIAWSKADDDFKRAVWAELPGRESRSISNPTTEVAHAAIASAVPRCDAGI